MLLTGVARPGRPQDSDSDDGLGDTMSSTKTFSSFVDDSHEKKESRHSTRQSVRSQRSTRSHMSHRSRGSTRGGAAAAWLMLIAGAAWLMLMLVGESDDDTEAKAKLVTNGSEIGSEDETILCSEALGSEDSAYYYESGYGSDEPGFEVATEDVKLKSILQTIEMNRGSSECAEWQACS